jgi:ATP-dependent protease ClpP protease subunit
MFDSIETRTALRSFYKARGEAYLGEIDPTHVDEVIGDLTHLRTTQEEIILSISSPGGETMPGFRLAQFIEQELNAPVTARVWGLCASAATYTLLCCAKRIAHPESVFVLHRQTSGIRLEYDLNFKKKIKEWENDNIQTHEQQIKFYCRKLKLPKSRVEKILLKGMGYDSHINATDALKLGLITEISSK